MKHRQLIATLAAGAVLAGQNPPPHLALSVSAAMDIAQHEIIRRGLAATHHVAALYADADRQAEGAAFAVIVCPRASARSTANRAAAAPRLKLLIHDDGHTTLQPIPARARAHA
jgi:hypothetical protein